MGAQAITGKAVTSAARMTVDPQQHERLEAQRKAREQEAREQANLIRWNAQKTSVGGVEMTNAQAQAARQRFIDNEDFYAERAVQLGYIKAEDKDELKRGIRRQMELADREGRGTITDAERKEKSDWEGSRVGQAGGKVVANIAQNIGVAADADTRREVQQADAASLMKSSRSTSIARSDDVFQASPKIKADFSEVVAATTPPQPSAAPSAPPPLPRRVSDSGLDA